MILHESKRASLSPFYRMRESYYLWALGYIMACRGRIFEDCAILIMGCLEERKKGMEMEGSRWTGKEQIWKNRTKGIKGGEYM